MGPAGFKSEGEPIAIPYAPAQGSGDGGIGSLFALNPDAMGEGESMCDLSFPSMCGTMTACRIAHSMMFRIEFFMASMGTRENAWHSKSPEV